MLDYINFYSNEKSKDHLFNYFDLKNNLKTEDILIYFNNRVKYSLKIQDILEYADKLRIKLKHFYKDELDNNNFHIFYKNYKYVKGISNDCFLILSNLKFKIKDYPTITKEIKNTYRLKSELDFLDIKNSNDSETNNIVKQQNVIYTNKKIKDIENFCKKENLKFSSSEKNNREYKIYTDEKNKTLVLDFCKK